MQLDLSVNEWQHLKQMAAIGELTTGIVHDLKNQLACIDVNMNLIEILSKQPEIAKYTENIKRQLGYANEMINLMLTMGARQDGNYSDFDLALLMEDVATFFTRVSGRGITVKTYVDSSAHLISGCQSLISNSILNLCANARDAIGDDGTIEISLTRENITQIENDVLNLDLSGDCSVLTIRDTGCGIDEDKINNIFTPFFSTKGSVNANTGLGLANVIHTAKECGVGLTVESELGVGTTFKLYFKSAA